MSRPPSLGEHLRIDPDSPFSPEGSKKMKFLMNFILVAGWWTIVAIGCAFFLTLPYR